MIVIDRIEEGFAVIYENGVKRDISLDKIDGAPKEGDVLICCGQNWIIDRDKTSRRREDIAKKQDSLWE